jgi:hypothetical protein
MKVTRQQAINLFNELGFSQSEEWGKVKMTDRINDIRAILESDEDDDVEVELTSENADLLEEILETLDFGGNIEVAKGKPEGKEVVKGESPLPRKKRGRPKKKAADGTPEPPAKKKRGRPPKKKPADDETVVIEPDEAAAIETNQDDTQETKTPIRKANAVKATPTRQYYAGIVVKKYGLKEGVSDDMIADLYAAYGPPNTNNEKEALYALRNAWHAIRGYLEGDVVELGGAQK